MTTGTLVWLRRLIGGVLQASMRTGLVVCALLLVGLQAPLLAAEPSARLGAVAGTVAVVRADGSAVQPAPVDTVLGPGDRIATVGTAVATVAIAGMGQVQLGAHTTVIIRELRSEGSGTVVVLEVVQGTTVHRLTTAGSPSQYHVVDPSGEASVEARGAATFGVARDDNGNLTAGCERCSDGALTFPNAKHGLATGWARTVSARGDVVTEKLDGGLYDALARGATADDAGSTTPDGNRAPAGQRTGSRDSRRNVNDNDDTPNNTGGGFENLPTVDATIANFVFLPDPIVVQVGQTIRWTNLDYAEHTVTSDDQLFSSPLLQHGDTYTLTLLQPGTYGFFCEPHPQMTGTIEVQ
jgi:plastocyanin